jgi:hypothetical protein
MQLQFVLEHDNINVRREAMLCQKKKVLKNVQSDATTGSHMGVTIYNAE